MARAKIGKWGRSLAVRVPRDVAEAARLAEGERVELEIQASDIVIRRQPADDAARAASRAAAEAIVAEPRRYTLGDIPIRTLLEEGRRG